MTDQLELVCPECGHSETTSLTSTMNIGADLEVVINEVVCGICGYEGPPGAD